MEHEHPPGTVGESDPNMRCHVRNRWGLLLKTTDVRLHKLGKLRVGGTVLRDGSRP